MQDPTTANLAAPTAQSTLNDWLTYMHGIHVSAIDMGLSRVIPVFQKLGIDKTNAFVFTVAGTNGKGSTTATIAEICQTAGYKTALYQSPHLMVFNERVKINGQMVDDQTLINAFVKVEQARLDCGLTLSFFEMTTLAGLLIFAEAQCDVWVLEIGLGGRLDVVNVIDPNLAVITNVGIDHVDWLGDTREKIGIEKAGILRDNITLIYGESDMPSTIPPLIEAHHARLLQYGKNYAYQEQAGTSVWQYSNAALTLALPTPNLSIHNTATAITAILASGLNITQQHIIEALPKIKLAGRFDQRRIAQRQWLFDVAHNEHGIKFLLTQLVPFWQQYQQTHPNAKLHLIFSMLADKDIDRVLSQLKTLPINSVHIGAIDHPRGTPIPTLASAISQYFDRHDIHSYQTLAEATQSALTHSHRDDLILVCGSFYTISGVLEALDNLDNGQ